MHKALVHRSPVSITAAGCQFHTTKQIVIGRMRCRNREWFEYVALTTHICTHTCTHTDTQSLSGLQHPANLGTWYVKLLIRTHKGHPHLLASHGLEAGKGNTMPSTPSAVLIQRRVCWILNGCCFGNVPCWEPAPGLLWAASPGPEICKLPKSYNCPAQPPERSWSKEQTLSHRLSGSFCGPFPSRKWKLNVDLTTILIQIQT